MYHDSDISTAQYLGQASNAWWRHQMKTFSALLAIFTGNSPVSGEFPAQRPVTRGFDISLICIWINGWTNKREAIWDAIMPIMKSV